MKNIDKKQLEFNNAMKIYETKRMYIVFEKIISVINIYIQFSLLYIFINISINIIYMFIYFIIAFILADFINGLVHAYMDNNDNYNYFFGPLVAKFHLHHKKPMYKKKNIFIVYFNESGSKIWLALIQIIFFILVLAKGIRDDYMLIFVFFSFFSSLAELSHYLCHVSKSKLFIFLGKIRIVLNKKHHGRHHLDDNKNYAFLNGVSDPIINLIAEKIFSGYKETTDKHYLFYSKIS